MRGKLEISLTRKNKIRCVEGVEVNPGWCEG